MKPVSLRPQFLIFLCLISFSPVAQKPFNLTVNLPPGINKGRVEAYLEDGKGGGKIKSQPTADGQLVFKGDYYFLYAAITIQDTSINGFSNVFFLKQKPGVITFYPSNSSDSPFKKYSLENVIDFKEEKELINDYCAAELKRFMNYETKYGDKLFSGNDTAVQNYFFNVLEKDLMKKKIEYILKNLDSYYSFYSFRSYIASRGTFPADSLFSIFNAFPEKFKYSDEGNYLNSVLHGRMLKQNNGSIDFTSTDINKRKVSLSEFKGKKCVVLHFWATWCTPCMQELPAVKEISNLYKSKDVQIISIALPCSKYSDYLTTLKRYQMDWIQIYNDTGIFNKYGNQATPRICLIDKTGKLVYDKGGYAKNDPELSELKEKIAEAIK